MAHRTFDFSSDVGVEADASSVEMALVELGRAMAAVVTDSSPIAATQGRSLDLKGARDWPGTAVAWINELVFLFDTEQFLLADARLTTSTDPNGVQRLTGTLLGETFDPGRHAAGRGVKAATFHDASYHVDGGWHRFRLILDL